MQSVDRRTFLATMLATQSTSLLADDWTQWRGPSRDGTIRQGDWPDTLDGMAEVWRKPLQPSYSGPVVANGRVFVTETRDTTTEAVTALQLNDGAEIWSQSWPGSMKVPFFAAANGSWIRSTPAISNNRILVAGMRDVLVCFDATSGTELWRNDFVATQKSELPSFGFVCSPLIVDDVAYVQAGGGLLKVSMETGQVIWRSLADGGGMYGSAFSSPVISEVAGTVQLLVQTRKELAGVDPQDGRKLWSVEVPAFRGMNILPPTVHQDSIFTSSYGGGSFRFDLKKSGDEWQVTQKWKNTVQGYMSSPMVFGDHVYLHLKNRRFTCMDLESGSQKWSSRPFGKYWSAVAMDDRILALDERGELLLIQPNDKEFTVMGQRSVASNAWAHLAVVDDFVLVRDLEALIVLRWT